MSKLLVMALVLVMLAGCATSPSTTPQSIPSGCEQAFFYNQGKDFLPYGPMILRTGVATALMIEPKAAQPVKLVCLALWDIFKADYPNLVLAGNVLETQIKEAKYARPALTLLSDMIALNLGGGKIKMTPCDKNILMSLVKNIGIDAGASSDLFK